MFSSKSLLTVTITLFGLYAFPLNAMQDDYSAALTFFTPASILDQIKKVCAQTSQDKAQEFVTRLENNLFDIYKKTLADITDQNEYNVLHLACERGHADVVKVLTNASVDAPAFISTPNTWGINSLMIAILNTRQEIVQMLIAALSQNVKECTFLQAKNKRTVFHCAADVGNKECFEHLILATIDTGDNSASLPEILLTQDDDGNTVLHIALKKLHKEIAQSIYFYAKMAGITDRVLGIKNKSGFTASQLVPSCTIF